LGAGASYELGLPLVWELTGEIKKYLTIEKIQQLNGGWKQQGTGYSDYVIDILKQLISIDSMHYENIIGALEVEINRERDSERYQELHDIRRWLLEMIYWLLYHRQIQNDDYIKGYIKSFSSLKDIVQQSQPLWVFSLNHDINMEIIAAHYDIPIKSGFHTEINLPIRSSSCGEIVDNVHFECLSRNDMLEGNYNLFKTGEYGINLIKIHGALDIFAQGDELSYLKMLPRSLEYKNYISELVKVNEQLRNNPFVKVTNEIAYADYNGEMQFLRRSLLSGAYKFADKFDQIAPPEFLKLFETYINYCDEIVNIGYGFGDRHIDKILGDWLAHSGARKMNIVNPSISSVPNYFAHLCRQIERIKCGCVDYFAGGDQKSSLQRNITQKIEREFREYIRNQIREELERYCRT
jgi:hypothetical protein